MEKLFEIIENFINKDNYFIINTGDKSTLIFCMGYHPYKLLDKNHGMIDAYYYTSNKSYFVAKDLIDKLNENGYNARMSNEYIKPLVEKAHFGETLKTSLVAVDKYGTKIVFQAIDIDGNYEKLGNYKPKNLCDNCNKCKVACPANALENGFDIYRCLRGYQDRFDDSSEQTRNLQKNRIIGCDTCQRACPYNKDITLVDMDSELKDFLKLDNLLLKCREGRHGLDYLLPHVGKNFLRLKRFRKMTVNAIKNSENPELIAMLNEEEMNNSF